MPSILFINRVYPPESGATGRVLEYAAVGMVKDGWEVTVLTTAGERNRCGRSVQDGVKVIRIASLFSKESFILRSLGYAVMLPSLLWRALQLPRPDVVVTMTDPPMSVVIGPVLKFFRGSGLIHWAQDLYPEVAEEVGVFKKGGVVAEMLRLLSSYSLKSYDLTLAAGRCMADRLLKRGIPRSRVTVLPNAGAERGIVPMTRGKSPFRERHGIGEEFVIMYSGNMGRAHEFETVIDSARLMQERGEKGVIFLFAGDGPEEGTLRNSVARLGLRNCRFLPSQPSGDLSASLGMGDLHLVTMRQGMGGLVVPSKFYGVMAAGRPTLFVGSSDSEVARVIFEKRIGAVIAPKDSEGLVSVILQYRDHPGTVEEEGDRARMSLSKNQGQDGGGEGYLLSILLSEAHRISLIHKVL